MPPAPAPCKVIRLSQVSYANNPRRKRNTQNSRRWTNWPHLKELLVKQTSSCCTTASHSRMATSHTSSDNRLHLHQIHPATDPCHYNQPTHPRPWKKTKQTKNSWHPKCIIEWVGWLVPFFVYTLGETVRSAKQVWGFSDPVLSWLQMCDPQTVHTYTSPHSVDNDFIVTTEGTELIIILI